MSGVISVNGSQVALENWVAGGEDAISITSLLSFRANYKRDKTTWENTLDLAYGLLKQADKEFRKTDDKIDLTSKYGHQAFRKHLFYSSFFNFKTQFAPGYKYNDTSRTLISRFMAPAYALLAIGMDYKPNTNISVFFSPFTCKATFVLEQSLADAGDFGVKKAEFMNNNGQIIREKKGSNYRIEGGAYFILQAKYEVMKNITAQTRLDLFSNYFAGDPTVLDVNWESLINMKVNKYISASLSTQLIYDQDIKVPLYKQLNGKKVQVGEGPRVQFKEVFAVGFSYKF
ncbi:MAG: DUF3078 domain-containing protein [Bacteroidia bacterium]|nr:DUF3078 domain-containing protein [Bacteroidia bacterium]